MPNLDPAISAAARALRAQRAPAEYVCAECGRTFASAGSNQHDAARYCSAACKQRAWRRAQHAKEETP